MNRAAALLLPLLLLAGCPAPAQDLLALHEAARRRAPSLVAAEAARAEQQARVGEAASQLGPQLQAQWQRTGGDARGQLASLQLAQPLFDAARRQGLEAERVRLAAREADQAQAAQQLRQESARLYVQWHARAELFKAQQQLAQAYAEEATRMGVRFREGLAAAVDWRQSQSYQWLAEANARGAEQQLRALRQALVAHTADPALAEAALAPLRAQALPPGSAADTQPAGTGPAVPPRLQALRHEREAREQELGAARREAWPQLGLVASSQRESAAGGGSGLHASSHEWRLQLRVPLWDSGQRAAGRDAAQARRQAAEAALQLAEREQQRELATQGERLESARQQHATAQGALAAAAQTVAAMRVGQEQGSRSTGDVLLALQTESQLRQLAVVAQADAWLAWIDGLAAQGRFDEAALRTLNHQLEAR